MCNFNVLVNGISRNLSFEFASAILEQKRAISGYLWKPCIGPSSRIFGRLQVIIGNRRKTSRHQNTRKKQRFTAAIWKLNAPDIELLKVEIKVVLEVDTVKSLIDLFHAATVKNKNKTFCTSSLAVKNLLRRAKTKLFILRGLNTGAA